MPVLYLVDLYFGTDFAGKLLYGEVKKFFDQYLAYRVSYILDDFSENGHATLKISKEYLGIWFIMPPCDVVWDLDILDLSSKNKTEAIKEIKSYRPEVVFKDRIRYDDPVYTCGCST